MKQNGGDCVWPKNSARAHVLRIKLKVSIRDFKIQRRHSNENITYVLSVFIAIIPNNYFVKRTRTLLNLNSKGPYSSSESKIKFRRCLFTFSIKHEIRHFHVVFSCRKRRRNVQKAWRSANLLFCLLNLLVFLDVLVAVASLNREVPKIHLCNT